MKLASPIQVLKKSVLISTGVAALAISTSVFAASPAQACPLLERIFVGCDGGGSVTPNQRYTWEVTVYNPVTGSVEKRIFNNQNEALNFKAQAESPRWAEWQFSGISEPIHRRKFSNLSTAQSFLDNEYYCPVKPLIGRACVMKYTRLLAPRVTLQQQSQS